MSADVELRLPDAIGKSEDLPSPPGVVVEILRLSKDEDTGLDDLAHVISSDPALAAKLIKLSNSSMFAAGSDITTLERACVLLGMKTVQLMALSFTLTSVNPTSKTQTGFSLKEYWIRCLIIAVAGRALSKQLNIHLNDEAFLCGLLSQIGQLAILQSIPDDYRRVLERSEGAWPGRAVEHEVLGFDRSSVGAALLKDWGLPLPVCLSIAYSNRLDEIPSDETENVRRLAGLLQAAELTANVLRDDSKGEALASLHRAAETLGLSADELDALLDGLDQEIAEMAQLLDVELDPGISHAEIMEEARRQVMRISLGAAADLNQAERRADNLANENRALAERASKDELTGVPNRAGFDEILASEIEALMNRRRPNALGLLMLDADHFKRFNDTHGHRAGDEVLRAIGRVLAENTRETDVPARYGGEEFMVIAPGTTPDGLETLAERLRQGIEAEAIDHEGTSLNVTVSIGGACLVEASSPEDGARLLEAADQNLYKAKDAGRNRCVVVREPLEVR